MTGSPSIETQHGHPGIVLATLSLANVMALLDLFVVNVALHDIGVGLHYQSSLSDVAWVLNAYALFFGALLIPAGRFADKYGRKATFILGLAVFTVASLACAVSPDLWVLVGFRCVQAAGAAMIIPASLGPVLTTLPPDRVKRGVRVWAVSGAAAGSIGPVVGGLLTALSWRWIFVINLPIGIVAILVTWKMIPNVRHDRTTGMPDLFGSLMIVVTIGAISLGLLNGSSWGWGSAKIIGSWVVAVAAAVAFVVRRRDSRRCASRSDRTPSPWWRTSSPASATNSRRGVPSLHPRSSQPPLIRNRPRVPAVGTMSAAAGPIPSRSSRTRRAVLDATAALMAEDGLAATTIDAIRDRSGVPRPPSTSTGRTGCALPSTRPPNAWPPTRACRTPVRHGVTSASRSDAYQRFTPHRLEASSPNC